LPREYAPAQMAIGHHHDHDAERRTLMVTTAVVGVLLGLDLILPGWGGSDRLPFGVTPALIAAIIGGGRFVYLALAALLEGRVGADIARSFQKGSRGIRVRRGIRVSGIRVRTL
jgi:hypothetical protein